MKKAYLLYIVFFSALIYFLGPLLFQNIKLLFSRDAFLYIIQGRWDIAVLYMAFFSAFLLFLNVHPIEKISWKNYSIYSAFIVALFAEMFGFPLTVFLSSFFIKLPSTSAFPLITFESTFLGLHYQMEINTFIGLVVSFIALAIIALGWKKIYKSRGLATDGIYSFVRHPQYLGIFLVVTVWALVWPTLLTLLMWPILMFSYYRLAKREEYELALRFGEKYEEYKKRVPMFLPFLN